MGLDLALLPFDYDRSGTPATHFSHTILDCDESGTLFRAIGAVEHRCDQDVPAGFRSFMSRDARYEDYHYGETVETGYGGPLRWLTAEELLPFRGYVGVLDSDKNRAVWAYLEVLPPRTKVALYWH